MSTSRASPSVSRAATATEATRVATRVAGRASGPRSTASLDEALDWIIGAQRAREPLSVGLVGNAADVLPELVRPGVTPDVLTDQTSAHDMLNGYVPNGMSLAEAAALRAVDPA